MQHNNLKYQGIKAFIWDFFGKMATQGMGFIISVFLARLLEPSDFGLMAIVMVIIGIAGVFTDVGLGGALIQRRKILPIHYSSVFYFNIFIGLILTLITYFSAELIAHFYKNDALIPLVQVMSLSFIMNAFSSVQSTKLRKELNYAVLTKLSFLASLTSGGLGVFFALHYHAGVWSLVIQTLAMGMFYNILIWSASQWKPSFQFSFKALTQLWGFGFRMFLAVLLDAIFTRLDSLIIGKLFSPSTLGFFERAKSLNSFVIQYSSGSLVNVLFPALSKIQNDLATFQRISFKIMKVICFVVFLLLGWTYLISEELISLLFGSKWLLSANYFKMLVFSSFAYPISALLINILSSRGNSKSILRIQVFKNIISLINLYLGFRWGIEGYLYGLIIVRTLGLAINNYAVSREINLPFKTLTKPIITQLILSLVSVCMTLYIFNLTDIHNNQLLAAFIKLIIFTTVYVLFNFLCKTSSYHIFMQQFFDLKLKTNDY